MDKKEVAKILLNVKAVTIKQDGFYTWTSGIKSPIYCDNRLIISYPNERKKIIDFFLKAIQKLKIDFDIIAGTSTAGISWAAWISERLDKPMIYIRGEKKGYGKGNQIEGKLEKNKKVLIIEDLISTGGSSFSAVEAVRNAGGIVDYCIAIFTYEMEKSKKTFERGKCNLITLSNFSELVEVCHELNFINEEEKDKILEFSKDPLEWGEKMGFK